MPTLTVKTGILKGRKFGNLWEYMDAREAAQRKCQHTPEVRTGVCGMYLNRRRWTRTVCTTCKAVLIDAVFEAIPDIEGEKKSTADFWKRYREVLPGEETTEFAAVGPVVGFPEVGQSIHWNCQASSKKNAIQFICETLNWKHLARGVRVVGIVLR